MKTKLIPWFKSLGLSSGQRERMTLKLWLITLAAFSLVLYASSSAGAQAPEPPSSTLIRSEQLTRQAAGNVTFGERTNTGNLRFVRVTPGGDLMPTAQELTAEGKSRAFFAAYGALFGMTNPGAELVLVGQQTDYVGHEHVTYQQVFQGVNVFGAEFRTHFGAGRKLSAVNGTFVPGLEVNTVPDLSPDAAGAAALRAVAAQFGATSPGYAIASNQLLVYRAGLVQGVVGLDYLTYEVEVVNPLINVREFVFVDAHSGKIVDQFTGVVDALQRQISEATLDNVIWNEGANDPNPIPADWKGGTVQQVTDWNNEVAGAGEMYNVMSSLAGRNSYDAKGAPMRSVNNGVSGCPNANWNGTSTNYCTDVTGDDIVAHEWGHAYTEYASFLSNWGWQGGALNEAYSDIWGEVVDLLNGRGTDTPGGPRSAGACSLYGGAQTGDDSYRWLVGEDAPAFGGAIRDMWTPTCFGDPGKVSDPGFECGGEIHRNGGVAAHAFALLVDGGTYNGQTITALGLTKAAHIHWHAQSSFLTTSGEFLDDAYALEAACTDLIGVNLNRISTSDPATGIPSGEIITAADCQEVADAVAAVELTGVASACTLNVERVLAPDAPPLCTTPAGPKTVFSEDWEGGSLPDGWTVGTRNVADPGDFAVANWAVVGALPSGAHAGSTKAAFVPNPMLGDCKENDQSAVLYLESPSLVVPVGAPLRVAFDHWVFTEDGWDGGNVKASVNGGPWTLIPASAFTFNAYNSTLKTVEGENTNTNPLAGEAAFTGYNKNMIPRGSWGQSQVDLTGIVSGGDTVKFRFEQGQDGCTGYGGWYVDDVRVYSCLPPQMALVPGAIAARQDQNQQITETLAIQNTGGADLEWSIQEAPAAAGVLQVSGACDSPSDLPWLNVAPISGTMQSGAQTDVAVTFDSTGLAEGTYGGTLCIASNDPAHPKEQVPITLTVLLPPAAPSQLTAIGASQTQIDLSWTDNSDNESGFKVERSSNGTTDWVEIGTVGANVTSFPNTGLTCAATLHYRVRATNEVGDSDYSGIANGRTLPCPPATVTVSAGPASLVADGVSQSQITAIVEDADGKRVPDQTVLFDASKGTIVVSATTDVAGTATVALTSGTVAGTAQVTATAGVVFSTTQVLMVAGPPASVLLIASPALVELVDGASAATVARTDAVTTTITALIRDAHENPVSGQLVTFATTIGQITPNATTDLNGKAYAVMSPGTSAGTAGVTAQAGVVQQLLSIVIKDLRSKKLFLPLTSQ